MDSTNLQHSSWEIWNDAEEVMLRELVYISWKAPSRLFADYKESI